jgi:hypothetical protein
MSASPDFSKALKLTLVTAQPSSSATRRLRGAQAQAIAQEREADLVVHLPGGKTSRTRFAKSWAARLFRR